MNEIVFGFGSFFFIAGIGFFITSIWLYALSNSIEHGYSQTLLKAAKQLMKYASSCAVVSLGFFLLLLLLIGIQGE